MREAPFPAPAAPPAAPTPLVEGVLDYAIFLLDAEGRIRSWNEGARRIKGYERDEVLGRHVAIFYPPADRNARVPEQNLAAAATQGHATFEAWRLRRDGTRFWASVSISAIRDRSGTLEGFAKVTRDLTDRYRQERQVLAQRDRLELLTTVLSTANATDLPRTATALVLRAFCDRLAWDVGHAFVCEGGELRSWGTWHERGSMPASHLRRATQHLVVPEDAGLIGAASVAGHPAWHTGLPANRAFLRADAAAGDGLRTLLLVPVMSQDRTRAVLEFYRREALPTDPEVLDLARIVALALARVFERAAHRRQLRQISQRLIAAQDDERARIARELHDELGQVLASVKLTLESVAQLSHGRRTLGQIRDSIAVVNGALNRTRDLAYGLHPVMLEDLGLDASLRSLVRSLSRPEGPAIELATDPLPPLAAPITIAAYRIVQEAVRNALEHARARTIRVTVGVSDGQLDVRVTDDGVGLDAPGSRGGGLGILSMRERVEPFRGALHISAGPDGGTDVRATIPLGDPDEPA